MAFAILQRTTNFVLTSTLQKISFDSVVQNGGVFHDAATPTRLIVPSGVTRLNLSAVFGNGAGSTSEMDYILDLLKNGVRYTAVIHDTNESGSYAMDFGEVECAPGDYFELETQRYNSLNRTYAPGDVTFSASTSDRIGFVRLNFDTTTNLSLDYDGTTDRTDLTAEYDNKNAWDAANNRIVVPAGVSAIRVTASSRANDFFVSIIDKVYVNGVAARTVINGRDHMDFGSSGPTFGEIAVSPGDFVTFRTEIFADASDVWLPDMCHYSVEFIP